MRQADVNIVPMMKSGEHESTLWHCKTNKITTVMFLRNVLILFIKLVSLILLKLLKIYKILNNQAAGGK